MNTIEAIRNEIKRLEEIHERNLKKPMERGRIGFAHGVVECCDRILFFIDSLPGEPAPKGYDEAYLNECIAKASKTWEGVDVDKYVDEVRGNRPMNSDSLEEAARHSEILAYPMPEDGDIEKVMKVQEARIFHEIGFKAGAQWQKEQGYTKETTVYANRWTDIDEVTVSLGHGEYGFKAMDKVIVQIRKA